jgi:hypothetical protein
MMCVGIAVHNGGFELTGPLTAALKADAAWRLLTPVLEAWAVTRPGDFPNYAAGT